MFFKYNRSLCSILFTAAWETLLELLQIAAPGTPAAVLVIQTAGESLNFNPHIHGVVTSGTFDGDIFYELGPY